MPAKAPKRRPMPLGRSLSSAPQPAAAGVCMRARARAQRHPCRAATHLDERQQAAGGEADGDAGEVAGVGGLAKGPDADDGDNELGGVGWGGGSMGGC